MVTRPDSPSSSSSSSTSSNSVMDNIFSDDGNIMLAAIISLLVVILFVLLLHLYAKWFLAQARQRRRSSMSASHVLGPTARFHHFHTFTFETTLLDSPTKGLDASIISSIPIFVYKSEEEEHHGLECVVCLSAFEENDIGRKLPKCGHGFHVECIDMWLHSHSSCPICRAPVVSETEKKVLLEGVNSSQERTSNGEDDASAAAAVAMAGDDHVSLDDGADSSRLEIVIEIPSSDKNVVVNVNDSLSSSSSSSTTSSSCSMMSQSLQLSCSLKRMLSKNRSSSECNKVYPSSNVHELES